MGTYTLTSWVQVILVKSSQLTMFGPWQRVDSIPPPNRRLSCHYSNAILGSFGAGQFRQYTIMEIFILVISIMSNPPRSTIRMACVIPKPQQSRMFNVSMASPGGCRGRQYGSEVSMCRWLTPRGIGREKVSDILVRNQSMKK